MDHARREVIGSNPKSGMSSIFVLQDFAIFYLTIVLKRNNVNIDTLNSQQVSIKIPTYECNKLDI
jgi:hypothetical protein